MSIRSRLALASPVWAYAVNRSREAARLTATVRAMEHDLAVVRAERDALRAHYAEAIKGRERAMAMAKELGGAPRWNEADDVWMHDHGVQP